MNILYGHYTVYEYTVWYNFDGGIMMNGYVEN